MKNKIVRIVVVFCCLILLVCPLFTVGVSAWTLPPGGMFRLTNPNNIPHTGVTMFCNSLYTQENIDFGVNYTNGSLGGANIVIVENGKVSNQILGYELTISGINSSSLNDGVYCLLFGLINQEGVGFVPMNSNLEVTTFFSTTDTDTYYIHVVKSSAIYEMQAFDSLTNGNVVSCVLYDMGTYFSNSDVPIQCPTLQEQLNSYTGTWEEFRGMLDQAEISGNSTLNEGLISELNEYREVGETTVKRELNSKTTFQQFIDQLTEYDMTNAIDVLNNHVRNVFNDGLDIGYAQGLEVGDEQGYNRGTSENFGQNLLGDTFNAPLNALNQWVLFETPGGIEVTMGGLFTAVIALVVLVIFLKMFAGG